MYSDIVTALDVIDSLLAPSPTLSDNEKAIIASELNDFQSSLKALSQGNSNNAFDAIQTQITIISPLLIPSNVTPEQALTLADRVSAIQSRINGVTVSSPRMIPANLR